MENNEAQSQMLRLKATLQGGKYRIERYIASGGFGNTYEVMNVAFEERMALKEFFISGVSARLDDNTSVVVSNSLNERTFNQQKEKFKKEARRLRKLHNPHIVQVHDLFEENGTAYYVMDYIDGASLSERLSERGGKPFSEAEVTNILQQVLEALDVVHRHGIWHLDLKPANIMSDKRGNVWLIDFGASKQMSNSDEKSLSSSVLCCTPGYAPTEQIEQTMDLIGPWTDLYALGATLYRLLTCRKPPTISEMMEDDAFTYTQPVSEKMKWLVRWMMRPNRHKRPQSVDEVRDFLARPFVLPKEEEEKTTIGDQTEKKQKTEEQPPRQPEQDPDSGVDLDEDVPSEPIPWYEPVAQQMDHLTKVIPIAAAVILLIGGGYFMYSKQSGGGEQIAVADIEQQSDSIIAVPSVFDRVGPSLPSKTVTDVTFDHAYGKYSYSGQVDGEGKPNGEGVAKFSNGCSYTGPFVHGVMQGDGAVFVYENGDTFEGSFENDLFFEGKYTVKEDGSYFQGSYKNGKPYTGIWYSKDGKKSYELVKGIEKK